MNNSLKIIDECDVERYEWFKEHVKRDTEAKKWNWVRQNDVGSDIVGFIDAMVHSVKGEMGLTDFEFNMFDAGLAQAITNAVMEHMQNVKGPVRTLPSGRKIWRDDSDRGSVIEYNFFGETRRLFVADAPFRYVSVDEFTHIKVDQPGDDGGFKRNLSFDQLRGDSVYHKIQYTRTDAWLAENFPELKDDDTIIELDNEERDNRVAGAGLRLPTLYELMVIYLEAASIDAMDPTTTAANWTANEFKINTPGNRFRGDDERQKHDHVALSSTYALTDTGHVAQKNYQGTKYYIFPVKTI